MKYVANGFSPSMVDGDFILHFKTISEEEFNDNIKNAISIIGHEEIAKELGVEYNRTTITLQNGDVVYLVSPKYRPSITEEGKYTHIPKEEGWNYRVIKIMEV